MELVDALGGLNLVWILTRENSWDNLLLNGTWPIEAIGHNTHQKLLLEDEIVPFEASGVQDIFSLRPGVLRRPFDGALPVVLLGLLNVFFFSLKGQGRRRGFVYLSFFILVVFVDVLAQFLVSSLCGLFTCLMFKFSRIVINWLDRSNIGGGVNSGINSLGF